MQDEESGQGSEVSEDASLVDNTEQGSPVFGADEVSKQEDVINPAWNGMLEALPTSLHSIVTPHLKQWDKNYQDGIQKVHSQYAAYKPFLDNQVDPDNINYALQVLQAINERPQDMIKALQEFTGMSKEEATKAVAEQQGQIDDDIPDELFNHPKFQELEKMVQTMAQHTISQRQAEEQAAQDAKLETELLDLKTKHGEYDEEYVLTYAMAHPDLSLEQCVEAYKNKVNELVAQTRRAPAPKVLGQGGGTVDNQITQENLKDPKSRKSVVAQFLQAAKQS